MKRTKKRCENDPKRSENDPKRSEDDPKRSENDPKPSENDPKPSETIRNRSKTVRNRPKCSENGPKPSETVRKRSQTVRNRPNLNVIDNFNDKQLLGDVITPPCKNNVTKTRKPFKTMFFRSMRTAKKALKLFSSGSCRQRKTFQTCVL